MPVNHGGFSNTRGFTILVKSLEQSGLYKCRSLNNTEHEFHFELHVNEACELSTLLDPFAANGTTSSTSSSSTNNTFVDNCRVESSSPMSTVPDDDRTGGTTLSLSAEVFNETNDDEWFLAKLTNEQGSNETTDQDQGFELTTATTTLSTAPSERLGKSSVNDIATTTISSTKLATTSSGVGSEKLNVSSARVPLRQRSGASGGSPTQADPSASPQIRSRTSCNYLSHLHTY